MAYATTNSMASSAASPVQTQTYNHPKWLSVTQTERWLDSQKTIFDVHAGKDRVCYVTSNEKTKDISMEVQELQCPFLSLRCRTSGYKNFIADSTTQECDQDSTNKAENYEEELANWESWLKWIGLTCPRETENLKIPSFVYILYVIEQFSLQDTQRLRVNHGQTKNGWQHEICPRLHCNS